LNGSGLNALSRQDNFTAKWLLRPSERCKAHSTMTVRSFQPRLERSSTGYDLIGLDHVIDFPNHSRSYDPTRRAVRFWGHDSAMEASFFISEDALTRIQPNARLDESGFLNAFDSNRDLICAAAARIYVRGSRGSYDLVAASF
jgi:Protein of unknown function (DUF1488)